MFSDIKPGDVVILRTKSFVGSRTKEATVTRVTATMVVIGGDRFNKKTGKNTADACVTSIEPMPVQAEEVAGAGDAISETKQVRSAGWLENSQIDTIIRFCIENGIDDWQVTDTHAVTFSCTEAQYSAFIETYPHLQRDDIRPFTKTDASVSPAPKAKPVVKFVPTDKEKYHHEASDKKVPQAYTVLVDGTEVGTVYTRSSENWRKSRNGRIRTSFIGYSRYWVAQFPDGKEDRFNFSRKQASEVLHPALRA